MCLAVQRLRLREQPCTLAVGPGLFGVVAHAWPLCRRRRQSVWSSVAHPLPPPVCSSPPQVCTEPLQSQQSFARDSHPPGGTITRGFQHCWEEFSPNLIPIHKEPVCSHHALLLPLLSCSNFASCHMKFSKTREKKGFRGASNPTRQQNTVCELCLKNYKKRLQFKALLNCEKSVYTRFVLGFFFFDVYCLK